MAKAKLEASRIPKLPPGTYWDQLVPGLHLRVSDHGKRTLSLRYRSPDGKHRRKKLGVFDSGPGGFSLAHAREMARTALADLARGSDPFAEPEPPEDQEGGRDDTFKALAEAVLVRKTRSTRESTQTERRRILDSILIGEAGWGEKVPAEIRRRDVIALQDDIAEDRPVMANRTVALIRLIYNEALRMDWPGIEANPAHLVEPVEENGRDRYLTLEEIGGFWNALSQEHPYLAGAVRVALLTAQRIGNVRAMEWSEIQGQTWRIPAEKFKGGREQWVPLSDEVKAILDTFRDTGLPYVFPPLRSDGGPHLQRTSDAVARASKNAKIPRVWAHDFRTTFNTHATRPQQSTDVDIPSGLGVDQDVADAVLGHKDNRLSLARYHGRPEEALLAEKREALARWGRFVMKAVEEADHV